MSTAAKIQSTTAIDLALQPGKHLIGEFCGDPGGPTLIAFGGIHGNEAAGVRALLRVAEKLSEFQAVLRGRVFLFAGNTRAIQKGIRFVDCDLNRHWTNENILRDAAVKDEHVLVSEDRDQREILSTLGKIFQSAGDEVYAIDLHSTSAEGVPFATVGDTMRNRRFAQMFPITILLGIEEQLEGTLLEYLNNLGVVTLGFEGGQHFAPSTVNAHEALIWLGLLHSEILREEDFPQAGHFRRVLKATGDKPRIVEVRYRHAIAESDGFKMLTGFNNFDPVRKNQYVADDKNGRIMSQEKGLMLMPLYQKLGEDGFFLGREVAPFWIRLSGILRGMKLGSYMYLLPGVSKSDEDEETLEVNTKVARLFPLQIFHLLGFRKRRWRGKTLLVSRRKHDTLSPFQTRRNWVDE